MGASTKNRPRPAGLPLGPPASLSRPALPCPAAHCGLGRMPIPFPLALFSFVWSLGRRGHNSSGGSVGSSDSSDSGGSHGPDGDTRGDSNRGSNSGNYCGSGATSVLCLAIVLCLSHTIPHTILGSDNSPPRVSNATTYGTATLYLLQRPGLCSRPDDSPHNNITS